MTKDRAKTNSGAEQPKPGRKATGGVEYRAKAWWGRFTDANGKRFRLKLGTWPRSSQGEARARESAAAKLEHMSALGGVEYVPPAERTCTTDDAGAKDSDADAWVSTWLDDRKARGRSAWRDNQGHWREHIRDSLAGKHPRDWTRDDLRALSCALDAKVTAGALTWKTAINVWATARKMAKDACAHKSDAIRCRDDDPTANVPGPERGHTAAKVYLYPDEFLRFVSCDDVPLRWRRAAALAIYLVPRAGELRALRWPDVDLEHGAVHVHRAPNPRTGLEKPTKTGEARRFAVEPEVLPLLRAMHDEGAGDHVIRLPSERDMSRGLKRYLRRAGITRAELLTSTPTTTALTWHDLRASGLTWMAVRGDDPLRIKQRAGHTDFKTTERYIREAEAVRVGFGTPFPPLPASLLGVEDRDDDAHDDRDLLGEDGPISAQSFGPAGFKYSESQRGGRDSNPRPPA